MTLSYRCLGDKSKPALLLLHGFMGSTDDWEMLLEYLKSHLYLVLVDLPGHRQSPLGDNPGFANFSHRLEKLSKALSLETFSLMGYSLGGRLAMAFAQRYPQRLNLLVLEGAHSGLVGKSEQDQRRISDQHWADRFSLEPVEDVLQDWYQQPVFADLSQSRRQALIRTRATQPGGQLAQAMMSFSLSAQPDYRETLKKLDCPVHYVVGEYDRKFSGIGQSLLDENCLTGLYYIHHSGHNIHREQPEVLSETLLSIVSKVVGGAVNEKY